MRTRQNILVLQYVLDSRGKPVEVKTYPNALEGTLHIITEVLPFIICYAYITKYAYDMLCSTDHEIPKI